MVLTYEATQDVERVERRYSSRWTTDRALLWRMHRGRTLHCAKIVERSLNGMVLLSKTEEAPTVGKFVYPADDEMSERHGFRIAVIRRTEDVTAGRRCCAEILS